MTQQKPTNPAPLWQHIATALAALRNCEARGMDHAEAWRDRLAQIERDLLPSGSGFDAGTRIDADESRADRITLQTAFHHMNDSGFYDGWTHHSVTLRPAFGSPSVRVSGRDRNGIKDYIAETVGAALEARVGYVPGGDGPGGFRLAYAPEIDAETVAENAACLWESVLDADPCADPLPGFRRTDWGWRDHMRAARERDGMAALRLRVIGYAEQAETGWKAAQAEGFDSPFDWEFCPAFVAACVDWENGGLVSDWLDRCREIGRADAKRGESV